MTALEFIGKYGPYAVSAWFLFMVGLVLWMAVAYVRECRGFERDTDRRDARRRAERDCVRASRPCGSVSDVGPVRHRGDGR